MIRRGRENIWVQVKNSMRESRGDIRERRKEREREEKREKWDSERERG